jgi:hypothetical protein
MRKGRPPGKFTVAARRKFLETLARGSTFTAAAEACGVSREAIYKRRRKDPTFAASIEAALSTGNQAIDDEIWRRAIDGVDEPIVSAGKIIGTKRVYSDSLLIRLAESRMPEKYRHRSETQLTGKDGGPVAVQDMMPLEVQQRLAAILQRAKGRPASMPEPAKADGGGDAAAVH